VQSYFPNGTGKDKIQYDTLAPGDLAVVTVAAPVQYMYCKCGCRVVSVKKVCNVFSIQYSETNLKWSNPSTASGSTKGVDIEGPAMASFRHPRPKICIHDMVQSVDVTFTYSTYSGHLRHLQCQIPCNELASSLLNLGWNYCM